ncbi:aldehyde dehydrogenase family protein [Microbacterium sp. SORGH_AS_0421]|uniref:aldehyde dehydrogenase family protein n=1 Tax=Microbacterium sp. SORGH_AS_0421 TaxID=3041768 RepID=UPI00278E895B|nr:aldehyde dehydrogenase family protein [Microbacterium sp. SORGH_AS_0421]MDQ1176506.1 acyl-CoA reductase-like NAD-dependent aldehyde dehydrogenase [Microbacterium sp. SORGH_AS_0421]
MTFFDPQTWDGRYFDGSWVSTPDTAAVISPSTGETIGRVAAATAADLDRTVDAARRAQTAWAAAPAEERAAAMRRAAAIIEENTETLARWLSDEAGSAQGKAHFEASLVANEFHLAAATAMMPYGQLLRSARGRASASAVAAPSEWSA